MTIVGTFPSQLFLAAPRRAIDESQRQLAEAQVEATTGRHADMGIALGARTGSAVGLRLDLAATAQAKETAEQAGVRASAAQAALSSLNGLAEQFRATLSGARSAENGRILAANAARSALGALRDQLSASYDGQYIFSGLAGDRAPLADYGEGPRTAVIAAFSARFGFAPDDPAAAALDAAQLTDFAETEFAALFEDSSWRQTWSSAVDTSPQVRVGGGQPLGLSTTANAPFARSLAQAFSLIETLGSGKIGAAAFQAAAQTALARLGQAQSSISAEQARIGIAQNSLSSAAAALDDRKAKLETAIGALEGVDPYEAATRVNTLMAQLQSSYALTGRISRMSLLDYI